MAGIAPLLLLGLASETALAQSTKVEGFIKSRSGAYMIMKTDQDPNFVVYLSDSTDVGEPEVLFKARRKEMYMARLV